MLFLGTKGVQRDIGFLKWGPEWAIIISNDWNTNDTVQDSDI